MAIHDFRSQRLYVEAPLQAGSRIDADREKANYLLNVLRLKNGGKILLFNGVDGEWRAGIEIVGRKKCSLLVETQTRSQTPPYSVEYCFAPLKQARQDYMVQKAVEMGVGKLQPVLTQFTQVRSVNRKRMHANAIEAAEQCGILNIPAISDPVPLTAMAETLSPDTLLVFCDEEAPGAEELSPEARTEYQNVALLVGPEGGFSEGERVLISALPNTVRLGLGPRILRADTAAVAALAIMQSKLGDWYDDK